MINIIGINNTYNKCKVLVEYIINIRNKQNIEKIVIKWTLKMEDLRTSIAIFYINFFCFLTFGIAFLSYFIYWRRKNVKKGENANP